MMQLLGMNLGSGEGLVRWRKLQVGMLCVDGNNPQHSTPVIKLMVQRVGATARAKA